MNRNKRLAKKLLILLLSILNVLYIFPVMGYAETDNTVEPVTANISLESGLIIMNLKNSAEETVYANEDKTYSLTPGETYKLNFRNSTWTIMNKVYFTCEEESGTYSINSDGNGGYIYSFESSSPSTTSYKLSTDTTAQSGGSVAFVNNSLNSGSTARIFVIPQSGYEVENCTAYKTSDPETEVELTKEAATASSHENYSFVMPSYDVTVNATFKKIDYSISVSAVSNGSINAEGTVQEDETVTAGVDDVVKVTAKPDAGYAAFDVKARVTSTGKYIYAERSEEDANVFTFTMPAGAVNVEATFGIASEEKKNESSATVIQGGSEITSGGTYTIESGSTGTITVKTSEAVIIQGRGVTSASMFTGLSIDCTGQASDITLRNVYISDPASGKSVIDFTNGEKNSLKFEGINILDLNTNAAGKACIHVPSGSTLETDGPGVLYLYKREQGAGIGGNWKESSGTLYFGKNEALTIFSKGSKQGATIGNGADCADKPGDIFFYDGEYSMIGVARGAIIGGSAGEESGSGGNVYIYGGVFNFNVDYSGAAIGSGGYEGGNDKAGGNVYVYGGSIRTYLDTNAVGSSVWADMGITEAGVNDIAITAEKYYGTTDENAHVCIFDTSVLKTKSDHFVVKADNTTIYDGGLHKYSYVNEDKDKSSQTNIGYTVENWKYLDDDNLYLFLPTKNQTLNVNGEEFDVLWDAENNKFTLQSSASASYENVPTESVQVGQTFTSDIVLTADEDLAAAQLDIAADGTCAKITKIEGAVSNFSSSIAEDGTSGKISFYGNSASAAEGLKVATVTYEAVAAGDAELSMTAGSAGQAGETADLNITLPAVSTVKVIEAPLETVDYGGNYSLMKYEPAAGEAYTYDGKAMYAKDGAFYCVVAKDASADRTLVASAESGTAYDEVVKGDINESSVINIIDAQIAYDISANVYDGFEKLTSDKIIKADVNNDLSITSADARAIQVYVHTGVFGK